LQGGVDRTDAARHMKIRRIGQAKQLGAQLGIR
jgi:hypothetical protein